MIEFAPYIFGIAFGGAVAITMVSHKDEDADVPRISKNDLSSMIDNEEGVIIDVRSEDAWKKSNTKIVGAQYEDPKSPDVWSNKYGKNDKIVLYCA